MNLPNIFLRFALAALALVAGLFFIPAARAQAGLQASDSRFLFIFDTSADMKKRLPVIKTEMNQLLATSLEGQLLSGNSIGVWTFDQNLRTGQFPLRHWRADDAATIATDINKFISKQHYAGNTRFDALQPSLDRVIQNSVRLTVLIFCDGEDKLNWTPYAAGVNQAFQQRLAEQKRAKQPFIIVLRTQLGDYVGCTLNFPPGMVSLPNFPPLPPPPPPLVKTSPPPAVVKPPSSGPPLVIIGTNIFTNWPPPAPTSVAPATTTNPVVPANPPAPPPPPSPVPMTPSNVVPAAPINPVEPETSIAPPVPTNPASAIQTNVLPSPAVSTVPAAAAATNAPVSPGNAGSEHTGMLVIGGVLSVAAGALAVFAWIRGRRTNHGSLITRSMRKD